MLVSIKMPKALVVMSCLGAAVAGGVACNCRLLFAMLQLL